MILVLLGPPGAGKGTQGARISVHYGIAAVSTGAMFREMVARRTAIGITIQGFMDRGEYVPDLVVVAAVRERVQEPDCAAGFLLDGFPRTIPQADALSCMLAEQDRTISMVLNFDAPLSVLIERFAGRRICPVDGATYHIRNQPPIQRGYCDLCHTQLVQRPDDAPEVVRRRLEVYVEKTAPLLEYYRARAMLQNIDATGDTERVFVQVKTALRVGNTELQ